MPSLLVRTRVRPAEYEIRLGRGILAETGGVARESLGKYATRAALLSNERVFSLYGRKVVHSLESSGFSVSYWLMGEGERFKSVRTTEKALRFLYESKLDRNDGVIALGGGVVGDLAGFAAAIYMRGIPFLHIPTTLLAQVDSSVGGKTAVNMPEGKNLIGSFHQPRAVIIDTNTLTTLPARELTAGWFEIVKQGAVASRKLFKQTTDFLTEPDSVEALTSSRLSELIASHVTFKASIVEADEREDPIRRDRRSRKILNFGHTVAHALEAITRYRRFRHGEAVGHGMLAAGALSKNLGLLEQSELELLREGVRLCGPLPSARNLDEEAMLQAIGQDKKRSSGQVQWVLLERIGNPRLVDGKEISPLLVKQSLREALQKLPAKS
ncbi:MAG: 3-dehydroquinate synthase [Acidobacteriota bacterium]